MEEIKLRDFYAAVAAKADTDTQKINAADVSRVLRVAGDYLRELNAAQLVDLLDDWFEKD
ncbi:MAG: hypothetical protein HRU19_31610 [Pseudobacteriovorax sp.]|nr:hypothetical protein [Pseudobacteriovorax sp.]